MVIFVVMFVSCLVYLFNLMLLIIEAVAANESDSGIGVDTFQSAKLKVFTQTILLKNYIKG